MRTARIGGRRRSSLQQPDGFANIVAAGIHLWVIGYADEMTLREARDLFFAQANLGPDGGYTSRWVRVESKPFPFYFPNWPARAAAARLHDLHHIAANYKTDWRGEAEISAWEIASGCGGYYAAWILDLGGWAAGLAMAPARTFRAFRRGRVASTNLYHTGFQEVDLDRITVGELRDQLQLRLPPSSSPLRDTALFCTWSLIALAWYFVLPILASILFWLGIRACLS